MTRTAQPAASVDTAPAVTVDALVSAYDSAKGADKARLRREATEAMATAIREEDFVLAGVYAKATGLMVVAAPEKAPVDFNKIATDKALTLIFAGQMILSGAVTPDGMPDDFKISGVADTDLYAIMNVVGDRADDLRDAASKIAGQRVVTGTKAPKHEVGDHVRAAIKVLGVGFHTVTKISNVKSDAYGDDTVSPGAIAAHFATKKWADRTDLSNVTFVKKGTRVSGMTSDAQADGVFVA